MADWYYDKEAFKKTPSRQDGIDYATEYKYRKEGVRFIVDLGSVLELGYNTWATGVVYFHRFYMIQSFKEFPHYVTACCCLFLAGKVEETPKKCKDIIRVAQSLLSEENFKTFGVDPKEEVMTLEKILLQTIKFDFKLHHPYSFLTKYAKILKGDKNKLQKMVQMAWTFINDSLCTTLSIQWEPEIIAIALMYLASKLSKFQVITWKGRLPNQLRWWEMFVEDLQMNVIEDICHQVLDLYSDEKTPTEQDSPQISSKYLKCENSDQRELIMASNQIPIHQQNPSVSFVQFAQVPPQRTTDAAAQISLVHPQSSAVSSTQISMIPTFKKEIVNADPRTIKSNLKFSKTEPIYNTTMKIKTEQEPFTTNTWSKSHHIKVEPTIIKTESPCIKTEPISPNTPLLTNETPFYNPEMTLPSSFGTPRSSTSTGNSQSCSPTFILPNFSMPPPAFNVPTTTVDNWSNGNLKNSWKMNGQKNNEINETDRFPKTDVYNNNYQKSNMRNFKRDNFDDTRFRNSDNTYFQRHSKRSKPWDSKSYYRNELSKNDNGFRSRRYLESKNRDCRRNYSNFNEKYRNGDDCTDNFKTGFLKDKRDSLEAFPVNYSS